MIYFRLFALAWAMLLAFSATTRAEFVLNLKGGSPEATAGSQEISQTVTRGLALVAEGIAQIEEGNLEGLELINDGTELIEGAFETWAEFSEFTLLPELDNLEGVTPQILQSERDYGFTPDTSPSNAVGIVHGHFRSLTSAASVLSETMSDFNYDSDRIDLNSAQAMLDYVDQRSNFEGASLVFTVYYNSIFQ